MTAKQAKHLRISGRVQGVGFRAETQRAALRLGVTGWVRNRPNGTVEAHAEGTQQELDSFVAHLRSPAMTGRVDGLWAEDVPVVDHSTFEIRF